MDIRQLQYLVALAREKHFTRVAVDRDPVSPLVLAAFECARAIEPPVMSHADLALRS